MNYFLDTGIKGDRIVTVWGAEGRFEVMIDVARDIKDLNFIEEHARDFGVPEKNIYELMAVMSLLRARRLP